MSRGRCKKCNEVIESKHTYDFVTCKCGNFSLDGGEDYQRVLFEEEDSFELLDE